MHTKDVYLYYIFELYDICMQNIDICGLFG